MALLDKFAIVAGADQPSDDGVCAVLSNLNQVLSSRRSCDNLLTRVGISDFSELSLTEELLPFLAADIQHQIETFEPRISELQVTPAGKTPDNRWHLSVSCRIAYQAYAFYLTLGYRDSFYHETLANGVVFPGASQ